MIGCLGLAAQSPAPVPRLRIPPDTELGTGLADPGPDHRDGGARGIPGVTHRDGNICDMGWDKVRGSTDQTRD